MACRSLAIPEFQMVVEAIPNPARLLRRLLGNGDGIALSCKG